MSERINFENSVFDRYSCPRGMLIDHIEQNSVRPRSVNHLVPNRILRFIEFC